MREPPSTSDPTELDRDFPLLGWLKRHGVGEVPALERALARSAELRRRIVEPAALEVETRATLDPTYVAEDVLRAASEAGWFSMMVPRLFGGQGLPLGVMMLALEEVSAGCVGLANLIAVHGLAVSCVAASGDVGALERVSHRLVESERRRRPALLSFALTEPGAGTDMEDAELLRVARVGTEAKPVDGGYLLSGRKVFISNGSIADTHVVLMPTDRHRPGDTLAAFLVPAGAPGLSVARVEKKMGQKACPAAELLFEDCFVPEGDRLTGTPMAGRGLDLVLGATRGAVGVFGTGVARGAYERALQWARTHTLDGLPAIEQQWVQLRLVDMRRNVMMGRASYLEAMLSNDLFGLAGVVRPGVLEQVARLVPRRVLEGPRVRRVLASRRASEGLQHKIAELSERRVGLSSALGAHAKVTGSDYAVENCEMAIELVGADGLRHDRGIEKLLRDAKLLQIYEGTNQLNRMEIHQRLVATEGTHVR